MKEHLPVENVEKSVETEDSYIVGGDVFNKSDFIEHDYLRNEGHCFEPETVAPHKLPAGPATVDYQSKD